MALKLSLRTRTHRKRYHSGNCAGGTTPYPLGALTLAKRINAECLTGFLCCSPIAPPPNCDVLICAPTGPEVVTGSTRMKAGTATKLLLNTLSTTLMVRMGHVYGNLMVDVKATNDKLRDRAARILRSVLAIERDQAFVLLDECKGHVKAGIVMHRRKCDLPQAQLLLIQHAGQLEAACTAEIA